MKEFAGVSVTGRYLLKLEMRKKYFKGTKGTKTVCLMERP